MTKINNVRSTSLAVSCALATLTVGSATAATINVFANGGFEVTGTGSPAESWLAAAEGYSISNDSRTGNNAALLSVDFPAAAVLLQDSVAHGLQPTLIPGEIASFSFYAKGNVSETGNILYQLRFLDSGGGNVYSSGLVFFQGSLNTSTYTQIVHPDLVIPAGANAAFLEISQASGPVSQGGIAGNVLIDDIVLSTVPEPSAFVLLGGGLGLLTLRRRRA